MQNMGFSYNKYILRKNWNKVLMIEIPKYHREKDERMDDEKDELDLSNLLM